MDTPTPDMIRSARDAAGHTMHQAAEAVGATQGAWKKWEYAERTMHAGLWLLYLLQTGQHPAKKITDRG
jgi:hypothetical protein